ncbi:MAG: hypothetical protein NTW52_06690 [Planctomycetota bacterium]|nr:hypothetical protein [Planctomycetota bacterium]
MNLQPSLAAIPHVPITQKQRWLYWNVPANVAAIWIRQGKTHLPNATGIEWEELNWPIDHPLDAIETLQQLDRSTCILVGIDHNPEGQMLQNLITLNCLAESVLPQVSAHGIDTGGTRMQSKVFLIVACFECNAFLKSSLLELGADYVLDRIESVSAITRMIAKNGRFFPATPHRFLPTNAV